MTESKPSPLFALGTITATIGACHLANQFEMRQLLARHASGDWGDIDAEDAQLNEAAVKHGSRILSSYNINGEKLWVIT